MEKQVSLTQLKKCGEQVCGLCEDNNKAEVYCQDCVCLICSICVDSHKRLKPLKIHKITSLENAMMVSATSLPCTTHPGEVVKYYCSTCQTFACSDCVLDHSEHKCARLEDIALEGKLELWSLLEKVDAVGPVLSSAIGKLDSFFESLSSNTTRVATEINVSFNKLSAMIEKRRKEVLHELREAAVAKKMQLELQKESLQNMAVQLNSVTDSCNSALGGYSDAEVLAVKGSITQAANQVIEEMKSTDTRPVTSCALSFESPNGLEDTISTFGIVSNHSQYAPLCSLVDVNPSFGLGVARGQESVVTLQTRDRKGENLTVGGADVCGQVIELTSDDSFPIECTVGDIGNGKYEIRFTCDIEGEYALDVMVDSISIYKKCHQRVIVRDYTRLKGAERGFATEDMPFYLGLDFDNIVFVGAGGSIEVFSNDLSNVNQYFGGCNNFRGLAVDSENEAMFMADYTKCTITKATLDGTFIASVGPTVMSSFTLSKPMGLCLTKDRQLLVCDSHNRVIRVLSNDLLPVRSIYCSGIVRGVSVDGVGNIHAAVTTTVQVFDIFGTMIHKYGDSYLKKATDIAFLKTLRNYSLVTDSSASQVLVFDWKCNTVLASFCISSPYGTAISQEGSIYVCDYNKKYVFVL